MSFKSDLNGIRHPMDLERKYDLSAIAGTKKAVQQAEKTLTKVENETSNLLESLIINLDGVILSGSISLWFYNATPTLENSPANSWTTDELKNAHLNDLYYDRETGYVYKFVSGYEWEKQLDGQLVQSMALTNASIDTTDHERQIFFETTPTPPYNNGDWLVKENGDLYICQIAKESNQTYHPDDFIISSQYTYGTEANHKGNVLTVTSGRITKVEVGVDELNSTMTETVNGLTTAQSQILQNTNNINLKVSKNDVINQINVSTEGVSINANKIALEGYTTINNGFSVDTSGNMTCQNATIQGSTVTLADNTEIIGGSGLLTNLQYSTTGKYANYDLLGFEDADVEVGKTWRTKDLQLDVYIPDNFTITEAKVTLYHTPADWWYYTGDYVEQWGYSRNIRLYKATGNQNFKFVLGYYSEYELQDANLSLTEIANAFGTNGYTATNTSGSTIQTSTSIDIKSYLAAGNNKLILRTSGTTTSTTDSPADGLSKTGMARAIINILGYKK